MNFKRPTKTYRASPYPAISPTKPENNLTGQTVLITGGATGIGLASTKAFAAAGAARIILVSRTLEPMIQARNEITGAFPDTQVDVYAISVTDFDRINNLIAEVGFIDVLLLNAGVLHKPLPILDIDNEDIKNTFEVNVFGPLNLIKAFVKLPSRRPDARKTIIYTSAYGINFVMHGLGGYSASKAAMTYIMRCIAEENPKSNIRSFAFHPAVAYTAMARNSLGLGPDSIPFDDVDLPAHYAVWLCSKEADYLQGRFLSANWDVDELKAKKERIKDDSSLLKVAVHLGGLE